MTEPHVISLEERQNALSAAIERLYVVFTRRPRGEATERDGFVSRTDQRPPLKTLRELDVAELRRCDDFKYFLPRMMELIAQQWTGGADFRFFVFGRLAYEEFEWTARERTALDEYLMALWLAVLAVGTWERDVNDCLAGIAGAVDDLKVWLEAWENDSSASARRSLAAMINDAAPSLLKRHWICGLNAKSASQVLNWICDSSVGTILEQMFFQADDDEREFELSLAIEQVKCLRQLPRG